MMGSESTGSRQTSVRSSANFEHGEVNKKLSAPQGGHLVKSLDPAAISSQDANPGVKTNNGQKKKLVETPAFGTKTKGFFKDGG